MAGPQWTPPSVAMASRTLVGGTPARQQVDRSTDREQFNGTSPLQNTPLSAPVRSEDDSSGTNDAEQSVESRSSTTSAPVEQELFVDQNPDNMNVHGAEQNVEGCEEHNAALALRVKQTGEESEPLQGQLEPLQAQLVVDTARNMAVRAELNSLQSEYEGLD
ncbi:hypothetical protein HBH70_158730 [Parastagonospora nodorum]|uniref:Uncharacterized protein n=1 Tax=Phaeosphaeria nodorum (strain SN15 / ATCC MYA-4574 / FGSC 10173) TaxID=321614 RepID=A0A7U2I2C7_PHANO|nr:hypothetical protein HBH54_224200 [Parastagonospora nodorum]QRC97276.1 hypothetical protein JI435_434760 [Parastagonospora nodorum SN15]KAH3947036.1 hypothetical protein HBH53_122150 [Parastagonospora nodorum]KAH3969777.1 hypothetical protein HBH52_170170 [Parastagonospora nodorum]KAH3973549.1 hypothetical protein HBH51_095370 [Parastagonospora nodorum]